MWSRRQAIICAFIVFVMLGACGDEAKPPLVASDIVIIESIPGGRMSAGYFSLRNNTNVAIRISKITSPEFETVEIHESTLENGIAKMRRIEELSIPANSSVTLENGGKHLMLMRPTAAIETVALSFYSDGAVILSVTAPVTSRNN